jgi:hypothetical protein
MRTFECLCTNVLHFDSFRCLSCQADTGLCPHCRTVAPMVLMKPDGQKCGHPGCGVRVHRCSNFLEIGCNRLVLSHDGQSSTVCDYCRLTTIIPDLSIEGNREKWKKLEQAKHRVLYTVDILGLPFRDDFVNDVPALTFEFKADGEVPVYTGHHNGCITINTREADDVEREKVRVEFGEPQRTLVGHFRHEIGHYFWDRLIKGRREAEFRQCFGDERAPTYDEAMKSYYANGPPQDWQTSFVSAYATMHPWEDFAETFGTYLDMVTILDTGNHLGVAESRFDDIDFLISTYQRVGLIANELNRDMGLVDLVPEIFSARVIEKMRFVHSLASSTQKVVPAAKNMLVLVSSEEK